MNSTIDPIKSLRGLADVMRETGDDPGCPIPDTFRQTATVIRALCAKIEEQGDARDLAERVRCAAIARENAPGFIDERTPSEVAADIAAAIMAGE